MLEMRRVLNAIFILRARR